MELAEAVMFGRDVTGSFGITGSTAEGLVENIIVLNITYKYSKINSNDDFGTQSVFSRLL
ncbi:hypothetical protein BOX15_Mlig008088g1, partial [Macrostomum lignano]